MAFLIPDFTEANFPGQAEPDSRDFDMLVVAAAGNGVLDGAAVTGTAGMAVDVAAGSVTVPGGDETAFITAATFPVDPSDPNNGRYDLIAVAADPGDGSIAVVTVITGTPAAVPIFPPFDLDTQTILAALWIPATATVVDTPQIVDKRMPANVLKLDGSTTMTGPVLVIQGPRQAVYAANGQRAQDNAGGQAFMQIDPFGDLGGFVSLTGPLDKTGILLYLAGDSQERYTVNHDGQTEWGNGTDARDTDLYRADVATLQTDGKFIAADIDGGTI